MGTDAFRCVVTARALDFQRRLQNAGPEYIEDSRSVFLERASRDAVFDAILNAFDLEKHRFGRLR